MNKEPRDEKAAFGVCPHYFLHARHLCCADGLADPAEFSIRLAPLKGPHVSAAWVNPATGESVAGGSYVNASVQSFTTPVGWEGSLLILEAGADASGEGAAAAEVLP